jgi:hypothetical protein
MQSHFAGALFLTDASFVSELDKSGYRRPL